jgi:Response regulator containing CheY-like receiver, AAA-type ATPase, and DNA-binding domains
MTYKFKSDEFYFVVVDDDKDDLELIRDIYDEMKLSQYVKTYTSADDLLEYLSGDEKNNLLPSLIVLDYNMPKVSGIDLLQILKTDKRFGCIPVVFYSTTMTFAIEEELLAAGAAYCHQKPVTINGVRELMKEIWSIAESFQQRGRLYNSC